MKKFTLSLLGASAALLAACNGMPECQNQDMDKCGFGTVYSEERTAVGEKKDMAPEPAPVVVAPAPVAEPAPAPQPEPEPEPAPAPEPVDTSIMMQADEPDLTK